VWPFDLPNPDLGYGTRIIHGGRRGGKVGVAIASLQDYGGPCSRDISRAGSTSPCLSMPTACDALGDCILADSEKNRGWRQPSSRHVQTNFERDMEREHVNLSPKPSSALITDVICLCAKENCRAGIRSVSAAITSAKPARRRCKRCCSRWQMASRTGRAALAWGLDLNRFGTQLSFFFNVTQPFLEEIAKFGRSVGWGPDYGDRFRRRPHGRRCALLRNGAGVR